jgi:hypothetical protein
MLLSPTPFAMLGGGALSLGLSPSGPHHRSAARLPPSTEERSMGFAPPPRGGFAFIAAPERQSARERAYYLGGGRYICRMAIYPEPGGPAVCQVVIPCWANFLERR